MKRFVPLLLAIIVLGGLSAAPTPAAATPPSPPPCVWPGSPLNYATEVFASQAWGMIKDWPIRRLDFSFCAYRNNPFAIPIQVQAPAEYSSANATYRFTATFVFEGGRLTNDKTLAADLAALREQIARFENHPLASAYLAIAAQPVIEAYGAGLEGSVEQFELKIDNDNRIVYDPKARRPSEFAFADPRLLARKEQFAPLIGTSPIAQEFDRLVGIKYVWLFSEGLTIAQAPPSRCTMCEPYIHLNVATEQAEYFSLPSQHPWASIPQISRAHAAIEQQGYDRQKPSCVIGRGTSHNYSMGSPSDQEIGSLDIEVILVCSNETQPVGWKQVRVHVNADGAFEQPTVVMESISGGFIAPGWAH
jgi:hypothetical protein